MQQESGKEYWVNVYDFSMDPAPLPNQLPIQYGRNFYDKVECLKERIDWGWCKQIPIYRIHVKMKPVKTYKSVLLPAHKPTAKMFKNNWMDY